MEITYTHNEKYLLVALSGRLDTSTAGDFEKNHLDNICQADKRVIIDCSGLEYISSAGLRAILLLAKKLAPGGLCFYGITGLVEEVINLSGFGSFLTIYASLKEAEASFE